MDTECEFCDRINQPSGNRPWYDFHIVDESPSFLTIANMGALVEGYVLIVPRNHAFSMAALSDSELDELSVYETAISKRIAVLWESPTLFEHGSCETSGPAKASCIAHAHWHLVPGDYELDHDKAVTFNSASTFDAIKLAGRSSGYLMYRRESKWFWNTTANTPSQHFRRIIAEQVGRSGEWDYLAFPCLDNMRATIMHFTGVDPTQDIELIDRIG